jgi:hypothetical protein
MELRSNLCESEMNQVIRVQGNRDLTCASIWEFLRRSHAHQGCLEGSPRGLRTAHGSDLCRSCSMREPGPDLCNAC